MRRLRPETRARAARRRSRLVLAAAAGTALAATAIAIAAPQASARAVTKAAGSPYVALGDSYVAGPLIPHVVFGPHDPLGCLRSDANYAHLVAAALGLSLTDMSCIGAETGNMTNPQNVTIGINPPQLSAITAATRVVTMSIGGNDIGFSEIVRNCSAKSPTGPTPVGPNCTSYYDANGNDIIGQRIANITPVITSIVQQIHTLAPQAKVFLVTYPDVLPLTGSGCWPSVPVEASDLPYLTSKQIQLNTMFKTVAAANKAFFVNTYQPSVGHDACSAAATRWVEPIFLPTALHAAPLHPNGTGMAGEAAVIVSAMRKHGIT